MSIVRFRWRYVVPAALLMLVVFWHLWRVHLLSSSVTPTLVLQRYGRTRDNASGARACRANSCFAINRCAYREQDRIGVYLSPRYSFLDEVPHAVLTPEISWEYAELLDAIKASPFYEPDQRKACVTVPHIDTLNLNTLDANTVFDMLNSLPGWMNGENHVVFFMLPSSQTQSFAPFGSEYAVVAGGGFPRSQYREGLDISIPVFNPLTYDVQYPTRAVQRDRPHLLTVLSRDGSFPSAAMVTTFPGVTQSLLLGLCPDSVVSPDQSPWKRCTSYSEVVDYPAVLLSSRFCMVVTLDGFELTDIMMSGCIPVVLGDDLVLPFSEGIDWSRAAVRMWGEELGHAAEMLLSYPEEEMREQVLFLYRKYFSSMSAIALTTMTILNERVFPSHVGSYESWNGPFRPMKSHDFQYRYPRLLSTAPTSRGFTAVLVVTSKNQLPQVYDVIRIVAMTTDLAKVLVVLADISLASLPDGEWPRIATPIRVVMSPVNDWSCRFFPYAEIDTAAVLLFNIDEMMLTSDEIQFGYKVWSQFPDRQVHIGYSYSEDRVEYSPPSGSSKISIHATFHHTYYHYRYIHVMPRGVADWLGQHADCHNVAMELLIASYTGMPPIKVRAKHKPSPPSPPPSPPSLADVHIQEKCADLLSGFTTPLRGGPSDDFIFDAAGYVP